MRRLFYIKGFDKYNKLTETSISKGKTCIKTFTLHISNTRVTFKIFECFFEWIISLLSSLKFEIFRILKETQTFKTYWTESKRYCIIIAGRNTKIWKTLRLLKEILFSLCPFSVYCDLGFLSPSSTAVFFNFLETVLCEF